MFHVKHCSAERSAASLDLCATGYVLGGMGQCSGSTERRTCSGERMHVRVAGIVL
jgi:hypothetical protein